MPDNLSISACLPNRMRTGSVLYWPQLSEFDDPCWHTRHTHRSGIRGSICPVLVPQVVDQITEIPDRINDEASAVGVADRIPPNIAVNDCPRRPRVVDEGVFARRAASLRAINEDGDPRSQGFSLEAHSAT